RTDRFASAPGHVRTATTAACSDAAMRGWPRRRDPRLPSRPFCPRRRHDFPGIVLGRLTEITSDRRRETKRPRSVVGRRAVRAMPRVRLETVEEGLRVDGLGEVVVEAGLEGAAPIVFSAVARDGDELGARRLGILAKRLRDRVAVHAGKPD